MTNYFVKYLREFNINRMFQTTVHVQNDFTDSRQSFKNEEHHYDNNLMSSGCHIQMALHKSGSWENDTTTSRSLHVQQL